MLHVASVLAILGDSHFMRLHTRVGSAAIAFLLLMTLAPAAATALESSPTESFQDVDLLSDQASAATTSVEYAAAVEPVPVYRFWSPVYQAHFFTTDVAERDAINARWSNIWTYEGPRYTAFSTQVAGTIPLYRFWSARLNGHFYTADVSERDAVIARWPDTWSYEGVAYYVYPNTTSAPDTVPVARFWSSVSQHHFYTASVTERDGVIRNWSATWSYEGDNFRVPAAGVPVDQPPAPNPGPSQPGNPGDTKNCSDFRNYAEAKSWFDTYYPYYGDIAKLDGNNDGIPCESLTGAP